MRDELEHANDRIEFLERELSERPADDRYFWDLQGEITTEVITTFKLLEKQQSILTKNAQDVHELLNKDNGKLKHSLIRNKPSRPHLLLYFQNFENIKNHF